MAKQDQVIVPIYDPEVDKTNTSLSDMLTTTNPNWTLSWNEVQYSINMGKKGMKTLISGMSGSVKSGEVVAIMGGSGAGKSTLLNCLAGRIGPGTLTGNIQVNGKDRDPSTWRKLCAYVEQDDVMYNNISVLDTLRYSALLRLPSTISTKEKLNRVDKIIMQLGLETCKNTWIGDSEVRGISGGERKRVAIGMEMVTDPMIFFLDEPTSGLDAFNALNVIETIKKVAKATGKIVLMTIHQPRTDILEMFDKIILLSSGKEVFFGPLDDALTHFSSLGFTLPPKTNPSDYFLDVITLDSRSATLKEKSAERISMFQSSWAEKKVEATKLKLEEKKDEPAPSTMGFDFLRKWPNSWASETSVLLSRNMKDVARDKATIGSTIGQGIILMLLNGFIFFRAPLNYAGIQNRLGLLFFICVNQTFGVVMPTLAVFPEQRRIIKRERAAGTYRASSAYMAKVISTLPLTIAGALLLAVPIYWMAGLQAVASKYFIFILIVTIHSLSASALGIAIGAAVPNVRVGQIIGPLIIVFMLLFGGQFLNLDDLTWVFKWIQYVSLITYSNKALAQNEFNGLTFNTCTQTDRAPGCESTSGESILSRTALNDLDLWWCILINAGFFFAYLAIGYGFFQKTSRPLLKLK